ncbi:MAG: hypothetical protein AAF242_12955 [Bacteroidota bacterium]
MRKNKSTNPFTHLWDMATGGLLSPGSDTELTPNKKAGKNLPVSSDSSADDEEPSLMKSSGKSLKKQNQIKSAK